VEIALDSIQKRKKKEKIDRGQNNHMECGEALSLYIFPANDN